MDISVEERLKALNIKQLHEIARQYQIQLKPGKKQDIIHALLLSSISKVEWKTILSTYLKSKSTKTTSESSKSIQTVSSLSSISTSSINNAVSQLSSLEQRLDRLEIQVQQILTQLSMAPSSQLREVLPSTTVSSSFPSTQLISRVKFEITSHISPGESMTIDEILCFPSCESLPKALFDQIISELIDDALFDGAEANSQVKIQGSIGRIIRRR